MRRRRLGWGVADQGISSLTNLLPAVFVGRAVGAAEFGRFAGVMLAYQIASGLLRGVVSEPVIVRYSRATRSESEAAVRASLGASLTLGALTAVPVALIGVLDDGSFQRMMAVLALTLPALQLQDAMRYVALAWGRPAVAAWNDLLWLAITLVAGGVMAAMDVTTALPYFVAWTVGGAVAGPVGLIALRVRPEPSAAGIYLGQHGNLAAAYGFESVAQRGAPRLASIGVGVVAGVREFAGLRGALLFATQLAVLTQAVRLVAIPESVRGRGPREQAHIAMVAMWWLTGVTAAGSLVLVVLPAWAGRQLLGETWALAKPLLAWVLLRQVLAALALGPEIALRGFAAARASSWARLINSVLLIVLGIGGAVVDGATGAAVGMALAQGLATVVWFAYLRRATPD